MASPNPSIRPFTMPKWGIEMEEGTIREWHASEGDTLATGAMFVVIETDKIANDVELEFDGTLRRRIGVEEETYKVGQLIAVFADPDVPDSDVDAFVSSFKAADAGFGIEGDEAGATPETGAGANEEPLGYAVDLSDLPEAPTPAKAAIIPEGTRISPKAEALANELGVDLTDVTGTTRNGRVSLQDVEQAAKQQGVFPIEVEDDSDDESNSFEVIKLSSMRRTIAKRLSEANATIPHFYLRRTIDVDALMAHRAALKADKGSAPSVNDYIIKASAAALTAVPDTNVHFADNTIKRFKHADIAVAVAVDGGLVTPVVRRAELKSVSAISTKMKDLAARARSEDLKAEEFQGGTFSVSNLGMFGVDNFDAVINPPQGAILAVGTIGRVADEKKGFKSAVSVTLSCDHRAIDGALGGAFLAALNDALQSPETL